jgi:hypothetical protein
MNFRVFNLYRLFTPSQSLPLSILSSQCSPSLPPLHRCTTLKTAHCNRANHLHVFVGVHILCEHKCSSKTLVLTRPTRCHIPEDGRHSSRTHARTFSNGMLGLMITVFCGSRSNYIHCRNRFLDTGSEKYDLSFCFVFQA